MKVFISWSGDLSRNVAALLKNWLPSVLQGIDPWMSQDDIQKGSVWFNDIQGALGSVTVGVLCVTQANLTAPWLLFEAGALSKGLTSTRVCPLLIDVDQSDIEPPLALLNCAKTTKEDMLKLVHAINANRGDGKLSTDLVIRVFEKWWPDFERDLGEIIKSTSSAPKKHRKSEDVLGEILSTVRSLRSEISRPISAPMQLALLNAVERAVKTAVSSPSTLKHRYSLLPSSMADAAIVDPLVRMVAHEYPGGMKKFLEDNGALTSSQYIQKFFDENSGSNPNETVT